MSPSLPWFLYPAWISELPCDPAVSLKMIMYVLLSVWKKYLYCALFIEWLIAARSLEESGMQKLLFKDKPRCLVVLRKCVSCLRQVVTLAQCLLAVVPLKCHIICSVSPLSLLNSLHRDTLPQCNATPYLFSVVVSNISIFEDTEVVKVLCLWHQGSFLTKLTIRLLACLIGQYC